MNITAHPRIIKASLAATALATAVAAGAPASALATTHPTGLLCSTYNAQTGAVTARLGYDNTAIGIENEPAGDFNYIDPSPLDRSQPAQFIPGDSSWDYQFTAGSSASPLADGSLAWYIDG